MYRSTIYSEEQGRSFDFLWFEKDSLVSLGALQVGMMGTNAAVLDGLAATPTGPASLTVNLAAGHIYQQAEMDTNAWGSLSSDSTIVQQQGLAAAQSVTLSTTGLTSGQSRWALIQASFSQVDAVRNGDPTAGLLYYYNSANPDTPFQGNGNNGVVQNTVRQGICEITIVYGAIATTGSEVPPSPSSNNVPMYLIDLAFGQITITSGEILVAGPSVGPNVPSNYPGAPFVAGLLNSHHSGAAGQAPQIKLASEVQGILPLANCKTSSANSGGGLITTYTYAGNPNGHVAGVVGVAGVSAPDFCWDVTDGIMYVCTTSGNASTTVWSGVSGGSSNAAARVITASGAFTSNATDHAIGLNRTSSPATSSTTLPAISGITNGYTILYEDLARNFNAYPLTVSPPAGSTLAGGMGSAVLNLDGQCAAFRYYSTGNVWSFKP